MKKILYITVAVPVIIAVVMGCTHFPPPPPIGNSSPVIDASWASPTATWGEIWRVYLKAHDPDGDIWDIRFYVKQPGFTHSDGMVILGKDKWAQMDGYCHMMIPASGFRLGFVNLTLTVVIFDRGGRKSREVQFPLSIGRERQTSPPPGFANHPLAAIPQVPRGPDFD